MQTKLKSDNFHLLEIKIYNHNYYSHNNKNQVKNNKLMHEKNLLISYNNS